MGKKNKSRKKYREWDDFFSPPATSPFGEEEEASFESQLLSDLIDTSSSEVELDFDSAEFSSIQTDAPFPDWNPQPKQVTPVKEEPQPTQQPFRKSDRSWNSDGQAVYEYDVALHLAKNFPMGLYQNNPYIKIDGVDVALDSKLVGSLIDKSVNVRQKRKISGQSFKYIFTWLQAILDGSGRILERNPYWIAFENGVYDLRNNRYIHPSMDRRLVVIPFLHAVPKHKMDKQLNEKLWAERDGIVWHAMNALKTLHRNGYNFSYCREGELLKRKYLGVGESSVQDFINEFCRLTPDEQEWTSTLYDAYTSYCLENEMDPVGRKRFSQMIFSIPGVHAQKFQKDRTQLQGARGICLRPL